MLWAIRSEHDEQKALFQWAAGIPELDCMYAIPNGGLRNKVVAAKLKAEGVKKGVPDICLPLPRGSYHGLYIEMKTEKGRATKEQLDWIERLRRNGYAAVICRGAWDAKQVIETYLGLKG